MEDVKVYAFGYVTGGFPCWSKGVNELVDVAGVDLVGHMETNASVRRGKWFRHIDEMSTLGGLQTGTKTIEGTKGIFVAHFYTMAAVLQPCFTLIMTRTRLLNRLQRQPTGQEATSGRAEPHGPRGSRKGRYCLAKPNSTTPHFVFTTQPL